MNEYDYFICLWRLENKNKPEEKPFGPFVHFMVMTDTSNAETIAQTIFNDARTSYGMTEGALFAFTNLYVTTSKIPKSFTPEDTGDESEKKFAIKEEFSMAIVTCFKTIIQEARANARKQKELPCT